LKYKVSTADVTSLEVIRLGAIMCFARDRLPLDVSATARLLYDTCQEKAVAFLKTQFNRVKRGVMHGLIFDFLIASQYCQLFELQDLVIITILESTDNLAEDIYHKWETVGKAMGDALKAKLLARFVERFKTATKTQDDFCHDCHTDFSVFVHRKHCTMCKKSFCKKCLQPASKLPDEFAAEHLASPTKVCIPCYNILKLLTTS